MLLRRVAAASALPLRSSVVEKMPPQSRVLVERRRGLSGSALPRLPVPPLRQTLSLFLKNLRPIVNPGALREAEKLVTDLTIPGGPGDELQAFLEQRAKSTDNWLSQWWLEKAYLDLRCPLPCNLSPALSFPLRTFRGEAEMVAYAAKLTRGLVQYKAAIDEGKIAPDMAGSSPLDMSQYKLLFGTTRIPGATRDVMRFGADAVVPPTHIVVARRGNFFRVDLCDVARQPLNETQIAAQLTEVIHASEFCCPALGRLGTADKLRHPAEAEIGIVSSDDRTKWAETYARLKASSSQNRASLEDIESSLFLLALDKAATGYSDSRLNEQHRQLLHGGGSSSNGGNRWFDKTLQFVVGEDGVSGITYEHSPAEGPPVAALMDYVMDYVGQEFEHSAASGPLVPLKQLSFDLAAADLDSIRSAAARLDAVVADLEVEMLQFKEFGKALPKSARLSPDSFCQLAFQLTFHKLHGAHPPTYETGTLRGFHLGRTETIRLPSVASAAFVEAMRDPSVSHTDKAKAMATAVAAHKAYAAAAMSGNGMDRHLLGLRLAAAELGRAEPALFSHATFAKLAHFQLSTSQVPTRHEALMAFGPSADDCYGLCYNPQENQLNISCSAFRSGKSQTSAKKFIETLIGSLHEMRETLSQGQPSKL